MPLVPPYIESLRAYEPGRSIEDVQREFGLSRAIKLASNENPIGMSPCAREAIIHAAERSHLYPNGGQDLREVLAAQWRVKIDNVVVGSGSDGIMSNIIRTFLCDDDEILTTESAFGGFTVLARSRGVAYRTVPYRNWHYDLPAIAAAINDRTKIIYLANPNNPTGTLFTKPEFDEFYRHVPERTLIILDEAYYEYARDNPSYPDSMQYRYDNVITLRTFSKAYGLAGLRVGYGFAHERLINNLMKVKLPFEPSNIAQAAAIGALKDREFLHRVLMLNARGMRFLQTELPKLGLTVLPSEANFVTVVLADAAEAERLFNGLLRRGVIVRWLRGFSLPQCLRISTGTDEDHQELIAALADLLRQPSTPVPSTATQEAICSR